MKIIILPFTLMLITVSPFNAAPISVDVGVKQYAKMKLLLVVVGQDTDLKECAKIIQKDFSFSGQFDTAVEYCTTLPSKRSFTQWNKQGFLLVIFLTSVEGNKAIEWRIYDTSTVVMVKGKQYEKQGNLLRGWAHNIADRIWHEIMGHESSFSTKIAYCKETPKRGKYHCRHIYVADYDGSNPQPLIVTPTVNIAPCWNKDLINPLLFYSELSQTNISLHVATMDGKRKLASNFGGLNMLPAFSKDGRKVVYCISLGIYGNGRSNLYFYEKGQLQKITNCGNNISPSLSDDGNRIFFCSDFETGVPLIYCYDRITGTIGRITEVGPCFSPSYCEKSKKLAYIKKINNIMQIFIYDEQFKKHNQWTTDSVYHKEDCSWSPCGNYLIFCLTSGNKSRLAVEHFITRERHLVTALSDYCNYPAWSPLYSCFPSIQERMIH